MQQLIDSWNALSERKRDGVCLLLLTLFCLIVFYKTVFLGQQISRIFEIANIDYLFRQALAVPIKYDQHCMFAKVCAYLLIGTTWREGIMPFWNPYIGCGAPFMAELQSVVLSPWTLFYVLWPSLQMHSYLLVAQQVLGAIGMFLAARALGLSRFASVLAAVVHLCCAHQQWRLELQMNHSFYPLTVWCFVRLYQTKHFLWALAAGAGCAAQILSGDAQVSLLSITTVSVLFVLMNLLGEARQEAFFKRAIEGGVWLSLAGINAICLASPVFLGFVEWVKIGDLSKHHAYYAVGNPAPWQSLVYTLMHPGYGGSSLYAGCLTLPLIVFSLLAIKQKRPFYLSVLLTAIYAFMSASRTGPFPLLDSKLGLMGLSRFEGMEVFLVQIAFLMAFGLDELVRCKWTVRNWVFLAAVASSIASLAIPPYLAKIGVNLEAFTFDFHSEGYGFQSQQWYFDLALVCAFWVLLVLVNSYRAKLKSIAVILLFVIPLCINTSSEVFACKNALPSYPKFKYPKTELLQFLAEKKERIVPIGYNLLRPNNNVVYKISSMAWAGPLVPPRLHKFIIAAGGHADPFTKLFTPGPLNHLLDLASIRYILSFAPVRSLSEPYTFESPTAQLVKFKSEQRVRMDAAKLFYDSPKGEFGGYIDWYVQEGEGENFAFQIALFDSKTGRVYWTGGPFYVRQTERLKRDTRPKTYSRMPLDGIVPNHVPDSTDLCVGITVQQIPEMNELEPQSGGTLVSKTMFKVADFRKQSLPLDAARRFKMVKEVPVSFVRVYENRKAMPTAYLVHKTVLKEKEDEVLAEVTNPAFDARSVAVIEDKNLPPLTGADKPSAADEVTSVRTDNNTLSVDVKTDKPGFLVVTDQYFPGWHAVVDGAEVAIAHANYLFKGIPIGPGTHKIIFYFRPTFWNLSLVLLALCFILNTAAFIFQQKRRKDIASPAYGSASTPSGSLSGGGGGEDEQN